MHLHLSKHLCLFLTLMLIGTGLSFIQVKSWQAVAYAQEEMEVLLRGPVHEAFAETVEFDPKEGMLIQKAPPDPIEELPPDQMPEGEDIIWIPGYWAWDDEMNDFIWVSGVWRAAPPGRVWMPGYWINTGHGYQWVSGYWDKADVEETEYLPQPPLTVESGPNVYAPSPDYSWIPGYWVWHRSRYVWKPGYWARMRPDWIWVPAHYEWTPFGYIFVPGYWDYVIPRRGILFAPVYFGYRSYMRHGFLYSPLMVINLDIFFDSLFMRPLYNHYYFGDYYDVGYYRMGFYPWFAPHGKRRGYDPIYAHQRWKQRHNRDWERRIEQNYRNRRDHRKARPSRRLPNISEMGRKGWKTKDGRRIVAKPLVYVSKNRDTSWRFKSLGREERKRLDQSEKDARDNRRKRRARETKKAGERRRKSSGELKPTKARPPTSPIKPESRDRFKVKKASPERYNTPKQDHKIEPRKRSDDSRKRHSRKNDSDRGWKSDGQRKKTDDKSLKTKDRKRNTDDRGVKAKDRKGQTNERGKKPKDRKQKSQEGGKVYRDNKQKTQDREKMPQAKERKRKNGGQKSQDRKRVSRDNKQKTQDREKAPQAKEQKRKNGGQKSRQDKEQVKQNGEQKNHNKGRIKDEDEQKNQRRGKKKAGRR